MRRAWIILLIGVGLGMLGYSGVYYACTSNRASLEKSNSPELAWLKEEFHLSDAELARVTALHEEYLTGCSDRCRQIAQRNTQLAQLLAQGDKVTPEVERLLGEAAQLRADCQRRMVEHFYKVSRTMPPDQGKRYLDWVLQRTVLADPHSTMRP
jgi:hypothetical protein